MSKTKIEWADWTWNPITGCDKIGQGCANCYALTLLERWRSNHTLPDSYRNGARVTMQEHKLAEPLKWKDGIVLLLSMGDLFHKDVPDEYLHRVFGVMRQARQATFQILTKRAERMAEWTDWPDNVWAGVSVESAGYQDRMDCLRQVPATVRTVSLEPLLGPLPDLDLHGIGWAIVGDESGPGARPAEIEWVREIRDRCLVLAVPFFFKQWRRTAMPELDGRVWDQKPIVEPATV